MRNHARPPIYKRIPREIGFLVERCWAPFGNIHSFNSLHPFARLQDDRPTFDQIIHHLTTCSLDIDPYDPNDDISEDEDDDGYIDDENDGATTDE